MGFLDRRRAPWHQIGKAAAPTTAAATAPVVQAVQSVSLLLEPTEPRWRLDDLILDEETCAAIREAAHAILAAPIVEAWLGDEDKVGRRIAVNFYGTPGTGKTSAADALAHLLGTRIMKVSYAELESRFVGETPKNLRTAFRQARDAEAMLFFDEADSILSRRFGNLTQSNDAYINQTRSTMMLELDAFRGVVVFATNLASNYDDAFVRRIASHIPFMVPGRDLRRRVWDKYLPDALPRASDVTPIALADLSAGFSPADVATAVRQAAVRAAVRQGSQQQVFLADLSEVIDKIHRAKREIGSQAGTGELRVTTTVVKPEDVPTLPSCPETQDVLSPLVEGASLG